MKTIFSKERKTRAKSTTPGNLETVQVKFWALKKNRPGSRVWAVGDLWGAVCSGKEKEKKSEKQGIVDVFYLLLQIKNVMTAGRAREKSTRT